MPARIVEQTDQATDFEIVEVQHDDVQCTKILKDGQIYILRGENVYTIDGLFVK